MRLKFARNHEHEASVRALYERNGQPLNAAPMVYYGYNGTGREILHALVSREEWTPSDLRWHLSFSAEDRVPTWDEIAAGCHALRPGVPFVLGVPPRSWWMNVNPHVLHAWETKDENLIAQWRAERRGDVPS